MQNLCRKIIHSGAFSLGCAFILLGVLCVGCSPRPGASFNFSDGKPIYIIRENTKEECLRTAERRCQSAFTVLEEGTVSNARGGWVEPERHQAERLYSVRVKCESF